MKVLITTCALALLFTMFTLFQSDNNQFLRYQEQLKYEADNCADMAALYYDEESFSEGVKIFNKIEGNKVIAYALKNNLDLDENFTSNNAFFKDTYGYYTYYFDGDGTMTTYRKDTLVSKTNVGLPHLFKEDITGYEQMIYEATIIVTIDAGTADYKLAFVDDPECIRTSGYEYWQNY